MSNVVGVHRLSLRPGVAEKVFLAFMKREVIPLYDALGLSNAIYKVCRGDDLGHFVWVVDIPDQETYDHYFPPEDCPAPPEIEEIRAQHAAIFARLDSLVDRHAEIVTDMVMV
jgi:hypothetical protein